MNRYWFKPKRYGLGASPSSWEGWVLTIAYVAAVATLGAVLVRHDGRLPVALIAVVAVLTIFYVGLCWAKTEGSWRWRWGDRD